MGSNSPLTLEEYATLIHLEEQFTEPEVSLEGKTELVSVLDQLLFYLLAEPPENYNGFILPEIPPSIESKRELLYSLLTVRRPELLPVWFYTLMDSLLQHEISARGIIEAADFPRIDSVIRESSYEFADRCAVWQGDITLLHIDAIVNAANKALLGCFQPFHMCIDNAIHAAAGPQLRYDCHQIMQRQGFPEGTGWAKITRAYNLPSKFVLHTVGPIIRNGPRPVTPQEAQSLANCYISCLDLAKQVSLRSVAFPCISTGVFGFPQDSAAHIALQTVNLWLQEHPGTMNLVVFDVFRSEDFSIYESALQEWAIDQ
ncbi:MAG TPA: protein-ADP-ribose hydrolase [Candidatus Lokiarchaeia archaeon]|nr:protein-ADP-ribose hydrolase [Candidatus Lokiarchaeia archaeon]